ncbi:hypothetical protein GF406_15765 [candidate division KSB1 bacterium]|nr:hypothetical protein [candidate division KSB1 bacterium]
MTERKNARESPCHPVRLTCSIRDSTVAPAAPGHPAPGSRCGRGAIHLFALLSAPCPLPPPQAWQMKKTPARSKHALQPDRDIG